MNPLRLSSLFSLVTLSPRLLTLTSRLRSLAHFSLGFALTVSDSSSSLRFVSSPCRIQSPASLRSLRRWQKKMKPASGPSGGGGLRLLIFRPLTQLVSFLHRRSQHQCCCKGSGVTAAHFLSQVAVNGGASSGYSFAFGDFPVVLSITLCRRRCVWLC
ncbi:uncharacterized protein DS421_7g221630 [Arachis hypogaea]|nr:uncharacterized protein DS421_7g221630 [Arachis hypogaea]